MKIFKDKKSFSDYLSEQKSSNKKIGFAPTMGALHDGHLSLYNVARKENDIVISSIFVNPTQFNNSEDLEKYPRTVEEDLEKLKTSNLVDAVYLPNVEDIYPNKLESKKYNFGGLEHEMEGAARPGHFDGVGTVVEELFNQVKPNNAYFGEKDFQQLRIIEKLVETLNLPITIRGVKIHRQNNGLAMSSRNMRLSNEEREASTIIFKILKKVNNYFKTHSISEINEYVKKVFNELNEMELEYFLIADEETLKEAITFEENKQYRAFIVVNVGKVRLIDNLHLD